MFKIKILVQLQIGTMEQLARYQMEQFFANAHVYLAVHVVKRVRENRKNNP